ncbi:MAG: hypothetical protein LBI42_12470 [Chitinispirillales bacterium]|jgi:hypothetical protein|nr:hypothetical protein [Chitinispirillales bacterium]
MIISSNDFESFEFKILPGFKPVTKPALKWKQLANGSNIVIDRLAASDIYEADVSLYGREDEIDKLIGALEKNRRSVKSAPNTFWLAGFNNAEKIFGAEIDYSISIKAMVTKFGSKEQKSLRGFSVKLTLRALNLRKRTGITAQFPQINNLCENPGAAAFLAVGFTADSVIDMRRGDSYTGVPNFSDTRADSGFFEGTFTLKTDDMAALRLFLLEENRGGIITRNSKEGKIINSIPGVQNIFGVRRTQPQSGFNVRITEWTDMGMKSLDFWRIKMKIAEETV